MNSVKVIASGLPESAVVRGSNSHAGKTTVEKQHAGLNVVSLPDFYSKVGEIEGYFHALGMHWCDGDVTLVVEKGSYYFVGALTSYEENMVEKTVGVIACLADELAHAELGADSYKVTYAFSSVVEFDDSANKAIRRH